MTITGRLPRGYTERNLKTGFGIRMGGRDTVPLDDCGGGETGEIGFAQYEDSDTLWVWPNNTHLDKKKVLHRVSIPKPSTNILVVTD